MLRVLIRVLQAIAILWLLRLLWRTVGGWLGFPERSMQSGIGEPPRPGDHFAAGPRMAPRELKKDPQCGTYVSPELSVRAQFRGEELHFCSRACEEQFRQTHSEASA